MVNPTGSPELAVARESDGRGGERDGRGDRGEGDGLGLFGDLEGGRRGAGGVVANGGLRGLEGDGPAPVRVTIVPAMVAGPLTTE